MKVNMMVQRLFAVLLMVGLVGLIPAENTQEVIVANAKELKKLRQRRSLGRKTMPK
jgi:cell division protein FtsB